MLDERRDDGYLLSDDRDRIDVELVHRWISTDSYWAAGRTLDQMRGAIEGSVPVGVYRGRRQVAFARAVTDGVTFAYVADVYVDRSCRGLGLGSWLVRGLCDMLAARGVRRFLLVTKDAHGVYEKLGFTEVMPGRWMESDLRTGPVT
ncbi:MAG TPA: GNAT family N-acetyltransferase [Actinoplanes sp.]|nr:GNAT family N-acetyltransferase [Actinoplanes sp.]